MMTLEPARRLGSEAEAWRELGVSRVGLVRFVRRAQKATGLAGEVDVLLTSDRKVRKLNREFRGKDNTTDVLSFPAGEFAGEHAGDLAVSVETARRQAEEQEHGLEEELKVLLLHGLLHLAGMDHETDRGEMAERERELRGVLGVSVGLIERVGGVRANAKAKAKAGVLRFAQDDDEKQAKAKTIVTTKARARVNAKVAQRSRSRRTAGAAGVEA